MKIKNDIQPLSKKNTFTTLLLYASIQPNLCDLAKTYQIHSHSRTCWTYNKNRCHFSYDQFFMDPIVIVKPLSLEIRSDEKKVVLECRKKL